MVIALFITCLTDNILPRAGVAVVKVLEHLGHEVVFPQAQTCCGQPMFNNGLHDEARDLARRMIRVFAPYSAIVTPSGSCAAMVRRHFPELFQPGSPEHASALELSARTCEFLELLHSVLKVDLRTLGVRWEGSATWHAACHLRELGPEARAATEPLLRQIDGLEYRPLEKIEQCCGFGGTFAAKYPDISGAMVADKVACVAATGAGTLVCNDAGCAMNIAGACRRARQPVRITSLAEIIAEGLGLMGAGEPNT